jgi:hypothetical protein
VVLGHFFFIVHWLSPVSYHSTRASSLIYHHRLVQWSLQVEYQGIQPHSVTPLSNPIILHCVIWAADSVIK